MIKILDRGLADYHQIWDEQKSLQQSLIAGDPDDYLIVCSHPAIITQGKSSQPSQILASSAELSERKIHIIQIERGGETTYHDPGQLILYPILNLNRYRRDVDWYLRQLEQVVIDTLSDFKVEAIRVSGKTGVWIPANSSQPERKIASLGVRLSRWCSMHGIALNISNSDNFRLIVPCGLVDVTMTDLNSEINHPEENIYLKSQQLMIENFIKTFK